MRLFVFVLFLKRVSSRFKKEVLEKMDFKIVNLIIVYKSSFSNVFSCTALFENMFCNTKYYLNFCKRKLFITRCMPYSNIYNLICSNLFRYMLFFCIIIISCETYLFRPFLFIFLICDLFCKYCLVLNACLCSCFFSACYM